MNTVRAVLGILALLMVTAAYAQKPGVGPAATTAAFLGLSQRSRQFPTPQFVIGGLAVGIWARVPPPCDVAANRSAAENPCRSPRGYFRSSRLPHRAAVQSDGRDPNVDVGRG
jgi:hypothetical protein